MFQFRVVKLSSPYLNVLIVIGVIMYYVDVILFGVDEGTPASRCTVNVLCMVSYNGLANPNSKNYLPSTISSRLGCG